MALEFLVPRGLAIRLTSSCFQFFFEKKNVFTVSVVACDVQFFLNPDFWKEHWGTFSIVTSPFRQLQNGLSSQVSNQGCRLPPKNTIRVNARPYQNSTSIHGCFPFSSPWRNGKNHKFASRPAFILLFAIILKKMNLLFLFGVLRKIFLSSSRHLLVFCLFALQMCGI